MDPLGGAHWPHRQVRATWFGGAGCWQRRRGKRTQLTHDGAESGAGISQIYSRRYGRDRAGNVFWPGLFDLIISDHRGGAALEGRVRKISDGFWRGVEGLALFVKLRA